MFDLHHFINAAWDNDIVPELAEYIRIPNVSKGYESNWKELGHMDRAVSHIKNWCEQRDIAGLSVEVIESPGLTPVILMEVPPFGVDYSPQDSRDTVLLYGHLDKQPEMEGWRDDLGPWKPVIENDRLYGRGGADDGYSSYASLMAIEAVQKAGWSHERLVILIEASEESGSPDLPEYLKLLATRIGTPSLVICLDSGCIDDQRLWVTTSLRGNATGALRVDIISEGVHSGEASGIVPSSFRIMRHILDRVENAETGEILIPELNVPIPEDRLNEAKLTVAAFPEPLANHYPFVDQAQAVTDDPLQQMLNHTWRPTLSYTGIAGFPPIERAGNVLRPYSTMALSFRLPPTVDPHVAEKAITRDLEKDPPYNSRVQYLAKETSPGWNAPIFAEWLKSALDEASTAAFGQTWNAFGEGGTIPFMGMLGATCPNAQFVITGVLGPGSNAHGPNEFLHIPTGKKVTISIAYLLRAHSKRGKTGSGFATSD
jgi:acetylornithine deacetylase/succinyl-diaminopimelate desuccinylase-like protein